jgi:hypothetical protein
MPFAGMGHQIYLDHLNAALPPTVEWIDHALMSVPAAGNPA